MTRTMQPFDRPASAWPRRLAPLAGIGLAAALVAHGLMAQAQDYAPPGYAQRAADPSVDNSVLGNPDALAPNGQYADPSSRIATLTDVAGGISFAPAGSTNGRPSA